MGIQEVRAELQDGIKALGGGGYEPVVVEVSSKAEGAATILGNLLLALETASGLDADRATGAATKIQNALAGAENPYAERAIYFSGQAAERIESVVLQAAELLPAVRSLMSALGRIQQDGSEAAIAVNEVRDSGQQYVIESYGKPRLKE